MANTSMATETDFQALVDADEILSEIRDDILPMLSADELRATRDSSTLEDANVRRLVDAEISTRENLKDSF